jgi:hypothetical protein
MCDRGRPESDVGDSVLLVFCWCFAGVLLVFCYCWCLLVFTIVQLVTNGFAQRLMV